MRVSPKPRGEGQERVTLEQKRRQPQADTDELTCHGTVQS